MATQSFPATIATIPTHVVDPDEVFFWSNMRSGLTYMNTDGSQYYAAYVINHDIIGRAALSKQYREVKTGVVPWSVLLLEGYINGEYGVTGHIKRASAEEALIEQNTMLGVLENPALAVYAKYDKDNPDTFTRVSGLYMLLPDTYVQEWPLGHGTGLIKYQFKLRRLDVESVRFDEGTIVELNTFESEPL